MTEPAKMIVFVKRGMVTHVVSAGAPIHYITVDFDIDTAEPEDSCGVVRIPIGWDGDSKGAYVSSGLVAVVDAAQYEAIAGAVGANIEKEKPWKSISL